MKKNFIIFIILISAVAMIGFPVKSFAETEEESLKKRVNEYMEAIIQKKWSTAYQYFNNSYREQVSSDTFIVRAGSAKVKRKGFLVDAINVNPSGNSAEVDLKLEISFQGLTFPNAPKTQEWVKENGQWYLKAGESSFPMKASSPDVTSK